MTRPALSIVGSSPFYQEAVELFGTGVGVSEPHSLHRVISYPDSFRAEIPAYFIDRFTAEGDVVLDPFCGSGTTALEAVLKGRVAYASDRSELAVTITKAKLLPADLAEVTLRLQSLNLQQPVDLSEYRGGLQHFYDAETLREILQLRAALKLSPTPSTTPGQQQSSDRVDRFLELLTLSLLHGHSATFFSVYSFPQISISPKEQEQLNRRRGQYPDYRPVIPRVLRRAAVVLRDGLPSIMRRNRALNAVMQCDARQLTYLADSSVDLLLTAPALPVTAWQARQLWLRYWFMQSVPDESFAFDGQDRTEAEPAERLEIWFQFMDQVLRESYRVLKPGKRAVFDLKDLTIGATKVPLALALAERVRQLHSSRFEAECSLTPADPEQSAAAADSSAAGAKQAAVKRSKAAVEIEARKATAVKRQDSQRMDEGLADHRFLVLRKR